VALRDVAFEVDDLQAAVDRCRDQSAGSRGRMRESRISRALRNRDP
jgi:hypothetical protein